MILHHRNLKTVSSQRHKNYNLFVFILALILGIVQTEARAEKQDSGEPVTLEADFVEINDKDGEAVFKGRVTLRQGTLEINASEIIVKGDEDGFQYGKASGSPAHFKQKREGLEEHIDGYANRIEYNGLTGKLEMFENARLTRGSDRVEGDYISYNIKSEFFQIMGGGKPSSGDAKSSGRVRAIIQPKEEN